MAHTLLKWLEENYDQYLCTTPSGGILEDNEFDKLVEKANTELARVSNSDMIKDEQLYIVTKYLNASSHELRQSAYNIIREKYDPVDIAVFFKNKLSSGNREQPLKQLSEIAHFISGVMAFGYHKSPSEFPLAVAINDELTDTLIELLNSNIDPFEKLDIFKTLADLGTDLDKIVPALHEAQKKEKDDYVKERMSDIIRREARLKLDKKKTKSTLGKKTAKKSESPDNSLSITEIIQYGGTIEAIKERLNAGDDINELKDATPLIAAIHMQRDDIAEMLLDEGADIHATCKVGLPPLYYAARNGSYTLVKRLLEAGAKVDEPYTFTPLVVSFSEAHKFHRINLEVFEEEGGERIKVTDQDRIDEIAGRDRYADFPKIVKLLLKNGADPNAVTSTGQGSLHYAGDNGEYELGKILLEMSKPEVNRQDYYGLTPLHFACRKGHKKVAELLLDSGADPTLQENYGFSPLHEAAENGHTDIVKLLLSRKADPAIKLKSDFDIYKKGYTALDVAKARAHNEVIKILSK